LEEIKENGSLSFTKILQSFWMGLRFDLLVSGFVLIIPFLLLTIYDYVNKKYLKKISAWWIYSFSFIIMIIGISNIEYFNNFYKHLDSQALSWLDSPVTVVKMLFQEKSWWYIVFLLGVAFIAFKKFLTLLINSSRSIELSKRQAAVLHLVTFIIIFFTIRGTLAGPPLKKENSSITNIFFLNELALNPVFVMGKSLELNIKEKIKPINFLDTDEALENVKSYLGLKQQKFVNPIAREVINKTSSDFSNKKNIVLVFMESMATWKMKHYGDKNNMSPFIDSLFDVSISYTNMHSAGIHTYAGVYSTNYSYPTTFNRHPMKFIPEKKYYGLPHVLKEKGYQTAFFIPHDPVFDNLWSFLHNNAYDNIYYDQFYPEDSIRTAWGVDDAFLFHFALNKIDSLHQQKKPFLATILTITDHPPYYIPDFIEGEDEVVRAARFADWARKDFLEKAKKKDWYNNTIFVFIGDHGKTHKMIYETPLSYSSIPLIIYYEGVKPEKRTDLTTQMDVFPILMKELKINYINNTMGQDVSIKKHPYVFVNYDNKYAVLSDSLLLVMDRTSIKGLYKYKEKSTKDYLEKYPKEAQKMSVFLKSYLQAKKHILKNDWQSKKGIEPLKDKKASI
jgi:phosphoglycerol transferase MdoB-like AlkP superfamily enzyme